MKFKCHGCGKVLRVADTASGKVATCPNCKTRVKVPDIADDRVRRKPASPPPMSPPPVQAPPVPAAVTHAPPAKEQLPPPSRPESNQGYPWEVSDELMAQADRYDASGTFTGYGVQCNEYLHFLGKGECAELGVKAELRIYPDMIGLDGRRMPRWFAVLMMILGFPLRVLFAPVATLIAIPGFLIGVVFLPVSLLIDQLMTGILRSQADQVRRAPNSPKAIKIMFRRQPLMPRYLVPGNVKQVVRVNMRRFLCGSRYLILFVYNRPIERKPGCLATLMRFFSPQRRILTVWVDGLKEEDADRAAVEAAKVLGLAVEKAFCHNRGVSMA